MSEKEESTARAQLLHQHQKRMQMLYTPYLYIMNQNFVRIKQQCLILLSRLPNRLFDDIRIPRIQDAQARHSVKPTARRPQVHVVPGVMVHAGFRQHGVVFNLGFTQRRNVVRDENEFCFPGAKGFEDRFVPKLFLFKREEEEHK